MRLKNLFPCFTRESNKRSALVLEISKNFARFASILKGPKPPRPVPPLDVTGLSDTKVTQKQKTEELY